MSIYAYTYKQTVNLLNMATIFFLIILSANLRNPLHAFKIYSLDILLHSSSRAVLSEALFGWEAVFFF